MNKIIWTEEKKESAIKLLTIYFEKYGQGECIMQSDDAIIESPDLLSYIADYVLIYNEGIIYKEEC